MSKSGVLGHFGTKEALQLAAVAEVIAQFTARVVQPALSSEPGRNRLLALCDNWFGYIADSGLPGGCLLTSAAVEFDTRPGDVHDLVAKSWHDWRRLLRHELTRADLDVDVDQALFELLAFGPALNQAVQLHGDKRATARAKRAVRRTLGL
ncbi:TetR/AcrR family transcriptional regulator [Actinocrispum wychmicini]|uniref:Tetracyclin repressor-like C-terminal domain-containing protein n=1 Tax=Actinocrispum wychmicini TaxID=1213861 RepID=A0A4V2S5L4_9PSEU|nr:TetR/AcrR family transcriptional regulator [Actinocrispum wychmicini]TCO52600.1 hypothetical protein EV192_112332 [Actinocrispum wychmicini]